MKHDGGKRERFGPWACALAIFCGLGQAALSARADAETTQRYAELYALDPQTYVARTIEDAQLSLEDCPLLSFDPQVLARYAGVLGSRAAELSAINETIDGIIGGRVFGPFGDDVGPDLDPCDAALAKYGPEGVVARGLLKY